MLGDRWGVSVVEGAVSVGEIFGVGEVGDDVVGDRGCVLGWAESSMRAEPRLSLKE